MIFMDFHRFSTIFMDFGHGCSKLGKTLHDGQDRTCCPSRKPLLDSRLASWPRKSFIGFDVFSEILIDLHEFHDFHMEFIDFYGFQMTSMNFGYGCLKTWHDG